MKKYRLAIIFLFVIPLLLALTPIFQMNKQQPDYFNYKFEKAKVLEIVEENLQQDPDLPSQKVGQQMIKVKLLSGDFKGEVVEVTNQLSRSHNIRVKKNMVVIVYITEKEGKPSLWIYSYRRDLVVYGLVILFILLLVLIGRMKGFHAAISLIITGMLIIFFMMPMIFQGRDPIPVTIITVSIATVISFLLISGFHIKTMPAILGTVAGVTLAGIISYFSGELAHLSGITLDKGEQLLYIAKDYKIQIRGLMFSAILISSLGAIMDIAMSMASSAYEINSANPSIPGHKLFNSVMNVGRDVMGTMANTLILAFTGSSLNTIMLIWGLQMSHNQYINMPFLSTEIIQGLSGSIAIVLTVPITAWLSVFFIKKFQQQSALEHKSSHKHKRS